MSERVQVKGTKLKVSISSVYTNIAGVYDLNLKREKPILVDTTPLDCGDISEAHTPTGVADPGTIDFKLYFDPLDGTHQDLASYLNGGTKDWKVDNANLSGFSRMFSGQLNQFDETYKAKSIVEASASIGLTTAVTLAP